MPVDLIAPPLSSPDSHRPRLLPEPGEDADSGPPGRRCPDRMQAQNVSSRGHFLEEGEGGPARELQVRSAPGSLRSALLCLRRSAASTRYFMFARSVFLATELRTGGTTVLTRYYLNCIIARCALLRPPSFSLHFTPSPETRLYPVVPDGAQRRFLHCLLNVIGHSRTAAGLDRCADPSAH